MIRRIPDRMPPPPPPWMVILADSVLLARRSDGIRDWQGIAELMPDGRYCWTQFGWRYVVSVEPEIIERMTTAICQHYMNDADARSQIDWPDACCIDDDDTAGGLDDASRCD